MSHIQKIFYALTFALAAAACDPSGSDPTALDESAATPGFDGSAKTETVKVLIDRPAIDALSKRHAVLDLYDYQSFSVAVIDVDAAGGREAITALGATIRDDFEVVKIDGYPLAAKDRAALRAKLENKAGMYIVQLVAPVRDEWLEALAGAGLEVITYMPENAYVVRADARAAAHLAAWAESAEFVQLVANYEPAYKIAPRLRKNSAQKTKLLVQVLKSGAGKKAIQRMQDLALSEIITHESGPYYNVELTASGEAIAELARYEEVFSVDEDTDKEKQDEIQGQILAANLSGNVPTGPGYLAFLAARGFNASQFGSFVVEIADDSHNLNGHPDLPMSRVAFNNNPTFASNTQGGHGFLNANIIGGFNDGVGFPNEDAAGFNYGLGIAPFARVGSTDIFGFVSVSATTYESTAYGGGARISSNSWGYISQYRYTARSQEFDRIVRDAQTAAGLQQLAIVFSGGNDGPGSDTVTSPANAKNVLTVAAGENVRPTGTDGCLINNAGADNANDIISFSSRGPVNLAGGDGRIKPDITAPGTHIQAGIPQSNYAGDSVCDAFWPSGQTLYGWSSGTSHSCPAVSGGAALLYQDFLNHALPPPSPAMIKAYLMNAATAMTGVGTADNLPSISQGMGRMDLARTFDGAARILVDQTQVFGATGNTYQVTGSIASSAQPFRVTVAWTDVAGPTTGAPWVNNLDLTVQVGSTTYNGNVFSGANSVTGGSNDARNNHESVFLPAGTTGTFTVTVRATNIAGDGVPGNADTTDQDFALVIYNGSTTPPVNPTIGVAPASFSFSGEAGGANPAAQSLNVTNTGAGTLTFTAASNQPWLSATPTSGTAPATLSIAANTAGLAAGTYTGAITISAASATNSPLTVPVTLTVTAPPVPTIAVAPASMSFSAQTGGANPASQTLSVTNAGTGSLTFNVAGNQPWLSVSPLSGTAPASITVTAQTGSLAAGTYNGTITVTSASASNSPVSVPVTFTVTTPPVGTERLGNPGFETSLAPWQIFPPAAFFTANGPSPHAGTGYSYCGSVAGTGTVGQQFTIPAGATSANLTYWLRITTAETTTTLANDTLFVEVRNLANTVLLTAATHTNLNAATTGTYTQFGSFNLLPYAGQTIRLMFRCTLNPTLHTTFFIDDVSVR